MRKKLPNFGSILVNKGVITKEDLNEVLEKQIDSGKKIGEILVEEHYISQRELAETLSEQLNMDFVDLKHYDIDPQVVKILPEKASRRYQVIILNEYRKNFIIGMADPLDMDAYDAVTQLLDKPVKSTVVMKDDLMRTLDHIYRRTEDISKLAKQLNQDISDRNPSNPNITDVAVNATQEEAPIVKLLNSIFEDAVQINASDIHIEPGDKLLRIRYRVDGMLQEHTMKESSIMPQIASRLKLMGKLNISENRLPQDGRFFIEIRNNIIDVRLSTLPTQYGESIVMRLLNQSTGLLQVDNTGMNAKQVKLFRSMLQLPYGLILVTGPTGSGKSTTLYAALNELNQVEKKVCTVEDPIEYRLERINQTQVNDRINLTFANILRAILRQDPDIIMIGEIRDKETADIAMRAAMTGHLVLSTLHTNDAASSAVRLIEMGIPSYLVATTTRGIIAQRLLRRICESCKTEKQLDEEEHSQVKFLFKDKQIPQFYIGKGCTKCGNTGYQGRMGIFEIMYMTPVLSQALQGKSTSLFTRTAENELRGKRLADQAFDLAVQGLTSAEEVVRIVGNL